MRYEDLASRLSAHASHAAVAEYGRVREDGRELPLLSLTVPGERWLVVTAGFHGEEPSGPLTLAEHFPRLAALARELNVGLRVYPCVNPSGFERGTRYNASGEKPNNDFLRYQLADGSWRDQLHGGEHVERWVLYDGGPKETRALRAELGRHPAPHAALDLHQDAYHPGLWTYAYVFGERGPYRTLMQHAAAHLPVASSQHVDEQHHTDADGLIEAHDGSVTDWYWRQGVPWCAALETSAAAPLERSGAVNLVWLEGFVRLAAGLPP